MKIIVEYESSWRNSFLDGSNNKPLPKRGRNFIGSMKNLKSDPSNNYKVREVTIDTILGVLNRLIGDQRKLYQTIQELGGCKNYFKDIVQSISFEDMPEVLSTEVVFIRNLGGSTDQNTFTGTIKANDPAFKSDFSAQLWGVLFLNFDQLYDYIIGDKYVVNLTDLNPISVLNQLNAIKKLKPVENGEKTKLIVEALSMEFDEFKPLYSKNGGVSLLSIYCTSLYLQLKRLEREYDMSGAKSKSGGITGISKNGFTIKDFMGRYSTGPKKLVYGNPYIGEEFIRGVGKIKSMLVKASGQLHIYLDISVERAIELKNMIDYAGVSSFYIGKKGLAYVSHIDVR